MSIIKMNAGSNPSIIYELWIADTKEELEKAIDSFNVSYPERAYGTHFNEIQACETVPGIRRYMGKFFTNMSRFVSCD